MISKKEEAIYNSFLYASRSAKNQPVRLRQNFDNLPDKDVICLKKLSLFLSKYTHINYSDFFIAPYKVYGADNHFDLSFFVTRKALKCYSIYCKEREAQDPDSDDAIENVKRCLAFIFDYCKRNSLTIDKYKRLINGTTPIVLQHLRDHNINFYILHSLEVDAIIKQVEPVIVNFIVNDFWTTYSRTRTKLANSKILKLKIRKGLQLIEDKLLTSN